MKRRGGICLLVLVAATAAGARDNSALGAALRHRGIEGASVGAIVIDADSGSPLFAHRADHLMIAASNVKVLTAVAALEAFGPTHRFATEVYADRSPDAEGAVAELTVVGGGDPSLTSEQMWRLAADLARAGLRTVRGDLVVDTSAFDDQHWHPAWGKTSARAYHAPVAALSVNYGAFAVEVAPGRAPGAAARAAIDPALPYFTLVNSARTKGVKAKLSVSRKRSPSGDRVGVDGTIGAAAKPTQIYRSVSQPALYAGHTLARQLAAVGIDVRGAVRRGKRSQQAVRLLRFEGKALSEIVRLMMKHSNNNMAETLVKAMGVASRNSGTWSAGIATLRHTLTQVGTAKSGFDLVDGSGLSRRNRVSPRALASTLRRGIASFRYGPELAAALPIANRDGTLQRRTTKARDRARAKTGLLNGATALTGIVHTSSGRRLVFSIIANDYANGDGAAMAALDAFVAELLKM